VDKVWLYGVECKVRVGVPDAERRKPQKILIDVGLELDTSAAAASDDFQKTVDYWAIEKEVRGVAERGERRLVETLADQVARRVLSGDKKISAVTVHVHKKPAVMPKTRDVVVEIRRQRAGAAL
jgi:7,8-dihydroneopterin aldolase/epimerase/oxygenase